MIWATLIVFTVVSMGLLLVYRLAIDKMAAGSRQRESRAAERRRLDLESAEDGSAKSP